MKNLLSHIIITLISVIISSSAFAERPKLVVNIIVDQLRTDYLGLLSDQLAPDGFRSLMTNGIYFQDVDFKVPTLDPLSASAIILTGNYPIQNGISSEKKFDQFTKRNVPVLRKNGTTNDYSPENLRLSTISDEIAIDGIGLGAIYSIAPDPQLATLLAGHSATGAAWLNPSNGSWSLIGYYPERSFPAQSRRYLSSRIDTMQWKPLLPLEKYPGIPAQKRFYPFSYTFPSNDRDSYSKFFQSGLASREITDLAIDFINNLKLGRRGDAIDVLNIAYSAAPFKYVKDGDYRLELEDTYLRLDRDLARLLNAINKTVGLQNTLIFLSSTGYYDDAVIDDEKYRIPGGEISYRKAVSLLNSYLSALHGNAEYVSAFFGNQLHLNHSAIEAKHLNIADIAREAASFIEKMSGVAKALTMQDIAAERTAEQQALKLLIDPESAGDIFVIFAPGWTIVDDNDFPSSKKPVRSTLALTPAFILSHDINPQVINSSVDAVSLAPTIAGILHIRNPNGAIAKPINVSSDFNSKKSGSNTHYSNF